MDEYNKVRLGLALEPKIKDMIYQQANAVGMDASAYITHLVLTKDKEKEATDLMFQLLRGELPNKKQ